MQVAAILNLKRGQNCVSKPVLQAIPGKIRFRCHLYFCKSVPRVSRAGMEMEAPRLEGPLPPMAPALRPGPGRSQMEIAAHADDRAGVLAVTPQHGDAGVTPYRAWHLDSWLWCHTRVQGFEAGCKKSIAVRLNLKSGETAPYRTVSANTSVPGQLPAPPDRPVRGNCRKSIGKIGSGLTLPRLKVAEVQSGRSRA